MVIVTGHPLLVSTSSGAAADGTLRTRLARLGVLMAHRRRGDGLDRRRADGPQPARRAGPSTIGADTLVLATTNIPDTTLAGHLDGRRPTARVIGDAVAARLAVHAIYEGRTVASMAI